MQLPSRKELKRYTQEDLHRSWRELLATVAVTATFSALAALLDNPAANLMALAAGFASVRLFVIFHDHVHGAFLRRSRFASAIFWWVGLILLSPLSVWRQSHTYHHRRTGLYRSAHIGSFPVWTTRQWRRSSVLEKIAYRWIRHPANALLGLVTVFCFGMVILPLMRRPRVHWDAAVCLMLHGSILALALSCHAFWPWFRAFFLPLALASFIGSVLFYVQHNFPSVIYQKQRARRGEPAPLECSSQLDLPAWGHTCLANIGYHAIHHYHEAIPFYRLPEVWKDFPGFHQGPLLKPSPSALRSCYGLAVWDERNQRMLTWKELEKL